MPHLPTLTASDGVRGPDLARANRAGSGTDDLVTFLVKRHNAGEGWGEYEPSIALQERVVGRPAPPPIDIGPRGGKRLSARFAEWLMGLPEGWVTDVPGLKRPEQVKALGNGVAPQQAYEAFGYLLATLDEERVVTGSHPEG